MDSKLQIARNKRNSNANIRNVNNVIQIDRKYETDLNNNYKQNFNLLSQTEFL